MAIRSSIPDQETFSDVENLQYFANFQRPRTGIVVALKSNISDPAHFLPVL
jgi:hypothetical protein